MPKPFHTPPDLTRFIGGAKLVRDHIGESPCKVMAWSRGKEKFFLKHSPAVYSCTTYSVKRESDLIDWLGGRLLVPDLVFFTEDEQGQYMVTKAIEGVPMSDRSSSGRDPQTVYLEAVRQLRSIPSETCPFDSRIAVRLKELHYLKKHGLTADDYDRSQWPGIGGPDAILAALSAANMHEETVFSHGDLGDTNLFVDDHDRLHFLDLGRAGVADKWLDVSFAYASLQDDVSPRAAAAFLAELGEPDNPCNRDFFQLLDELF